MLLGMFPMICFEFLGIVEKNCKKGKPENLGNHRPLHRSVALRRSEAEGLEKAPLGYAAA